MSFKFPFTTYHELNLDWILKKVETLSVNAEADANTIATYEERLQTAETQAQNAEASAANAQSAATSAASVAENALTIANSAQSSADASGALASQAATKADAAQIAADSARQAAETAQATAANFDGRITSAEQQASEALNMAQSFDEQARAAITTANNAANVATEAQSTANATALELARQRTALVTIGSQQTAAINSAGASQVTAIYNAGQAVLDSLPADYMNGVELVKDYTLGLYPQIDMEYDSILSFDNGADDIPVKDMKVNIIPNQSGTGDPSPSNIRPISGWTGAKVTRTGKNLLKITGTTRTINGVTFTVNADGTILVNGTASGGNAVCTLINDEQDQEFVDMGVDLVLSGCPSGGSTTSYRLQWYLYETGKSAIDVGRGSVAFKPVLTNGNLSIVVNNGTSCNNLIFKPMIRLATETDATFEPFIANEIPVTFPTEAGTVYGGVLDVTNGVLTVTTGYIESYNGETLPGDWISDRDVYTPGGTPSTGAQVVYELSTSSSYQLSPVQIKTLLGVNNVWADAGNTAITYRADLGLFITENSIANYTRFASMIAGVETGLTASKTYSAGDYFIVGQKLYKALTNIATGATFTLGTNCEETTVGAELVLAQ